MKAIHSSQSISDGAGWAATTCAIFSVWRDPAPSWGWATVSPCVYVQANLGRGSVLPLRSSVPPAVLFTFGSVTLRYVLTRIYYPLEWANDKWLSTQTPANLSNESDERTGLEEIPLFAFFPAWLSLYSPSLETPRILWTRWRSVWVGEISHAGLSITDNLQLQIWMGGENGEAPKLYHRSNKALSG